MRTAILAVADTDLTARARILRSAVKCFAENGYTQATVREIAAGAAVSPALVTHHFGGKAALRAECDAYVERFLIDKRDEPRDPAHTLSDAIEAFGPYLATMLDGPADAASALFSRLVAVARKTIDQGVAASRMHRSADPDAQAAALVVLGVAPFLLRRRLAEWAGDGDGIDRLAVPLAEIYTHGLYVDEGVVDEASAARGRAREAGGPS